jgi:hypothetical protein
MTAGQATLSPKHQRFVDEYLVSLNAADAYRCAGYKARGNSAEVNAIRLLRKAQIATAVAAGMAERAARVGITQDRVLAELELLAFSDLEHATAEAVREVSIWWAPIPGTPQESFWDDDTPDANLLFTGGWFAGKTMTLMGKMLKLSAINDPIVGFWLVPDWGHVDRTILPMLAERDPDSGNYWFLEPNQWHYNQRTHVFTWDGGGPIQFLTAENPDAIAGPSGAYLGVDEPGSIRHKAWRNATARVRASGAKLKQKVASGHVGRPELARGPLR